jgi:hypothetical protein
MLEKLTDLQLVKKFNVFYGNRRSITACLEARHLSPFWARYSQSTPPQLTPLRSILILSSYLRQSFKVLSLPLVSQTITCVHLHLTHMCYTLCPSHYSWCYHPKNIWWELQIIVLLIVLSSPLPCYLVPLTSKYLPQIHIFGHFYAMFLPQCETPNFTPIQKKHNNSSVLF